MSERDDIKKQRDYQRIIDRVNDKAWKANQPPIDKKRVKP
jgi:hypothetical protein